MNRSKTPSKSYLDADAISKVRRTTSLLSLHVVYGTRFALVCLVLRIQHMPRGNDNATSAESEVLVDHEDSRLLR